MDERRASAAGTIIFANAEFELSEFAGIGVEHPFQIAAHFSLHLVYFPEGEHALTDDGPTLVGISVVADHLAGDHKGRDEETMTRGPTRSGEAGLESGEKKQGGKCHGDVKS